MTVITPGSEPSGLIYQFIYLKITMYINKIQFISFLIDRTFRMKMDDFYSKPHSAKWSISQESMGGG